MCIRDRVIGSTFYFTIPNSIEPIKKYGDFHSGQVHKPEKQAKPPVSKLKILVAEDDPAVREIEASILRKFGYEVILAEDGQDAVKKFAENQTKIQIILMDMIMPHKNGKQALDEIRMLKPDIKVVFVSGYSADIVRSRGEIDENAELIMKPVNSSELLNTVRNMLDRA